MNAATQPHDQIASAYLQQLQELASEISVATEAIASNALPRLQSSVSRQEMLCASLADMAKTMEPALRAPVAEATSAIDSEMQSRIQAATAALCDLNLKYAALLRHSGKSIALLSLLCKSHAGRIQEDRRHKVKQQTWSCEA